MITIIDIWISNKIKAMLKAPNANYIFGLFSHLNHNTLHLGCTEGLTTHGLCTILSNNL